MPFPIFWPPRPASGRRSIRFYVTGTSTDLSASFGDHAWLFINQTTANTVDPTPYLAPGDQTTKVSIGNLNRGGSPMGGREIAEDAAPPQHQNYPETQQASPKAQLWSGAIRVYNAGPGALEVSFDGVNVHGVVLANTDAIFRDRHESGISVRRAVPTFAATYHIEAW